MSSPLLHMMKSLFPSSFSHNGLCFVHSSLDHKPTVGLKIDGAIRLYLGTLPGALLESCVIQGL